MEVLLQQKQKKMSKVLTNGFTLYPSNNRQLSVVKDDLQQFFHRHKLQVLK